MSSWKSPNPHGEPFQGQNARSQQNGVHPDRFRRPDYFRSSFSCDQSINVKHGNFNLTSHSDGSPQSTPLEGFRLSEPTADVMSSGDIIIAVMGMTGSGKTSFISRCVGEDVGIGHGLHSCTQDVAIHRIRYRGRTLRLIDTPGFDDTTKADVNVLNNISFWLSHAYQAKPKVLLSGIIYLHPVSETRMAGTAMKNMEMMKLLCGQQNLSAVWLVTTMWGLVSPELGQGRELELTSTDQFWGGFLRHGSKIGRYQNSDASAFAIIDDIIRKHKPVILNIQRQIVDEQRTVNQTEAGRYLRQNILQEQDRVQDRLARSAEELDEKLAAQDAAEVNEVLERQRKYQQALEEKTKSLAAMKTDMDKLREQKAKEFAEREKAFAEEKAAQEAKMAELDRNARELQVQRDAAVKRVAEVTENQRMLEDANRQLASMRERSLIAAIDRAIEDRFRESERVQRERQLTEKQESIFRETLKASLADSLVPGAINVVDYAASAMCEVM